MSYEANQNGNLRIAIKRLDRGFGYLTVSVANCKPTSSPFSASE